MKRILMAASVATIIIPATMWSGDAEKEIKKVQGTWMVVNAEASGTKLPAESFKGLTLTLKGNQYTVAAGDKTDKGTFKVYPKKKPKALDITSTDGANKGKTMLAIYEFKGDRMRVCYDLLGKKRPIEFNTKGQGSFFMATYKRVKK